MINESKTRVLNIKKQVIVDTELHALFKGYCSSVEKKTIKEVISNMIRDKLNKSGFKVQSENS